MTFPIEHRTVINNHASPIHFYEFVNYVFPLSIPQTMSASPTTAIARTILTFHTSTQHTLRTTVQAVRPFASLEDSNRALFKQGTEEDHVVITEATIFHPQGGGQPSDEGTMTAISSQTDENLQDTPPKFTVTSARTSTLNDGLVLHLGRFSNPAHHFHAGMSILQELDVEKRTLYSRLHTAGHVLGAAVRHLLADSIPDFDELKASHDPISAACEFRGLIDGKYKVPIQEKVDEYITKDMPVVVEFWTWDQFDANGVSNKPDKAMADEEGRYRVVRIQGCEVYPCGGTHVATTKLCGKTNVKKISRNKGTTRVSYGVA